MFQSSVRSCSLQTKVRAKTMNIGIYAINLDRSQARWNRLLSDAAELTCTIVRVPAVDGSQVPIEDWVDYDEQSFERNNGRTILPGEYGCYRSHLKAISTFLESGDAVGIIIEDDIRPSPDLADRAQASFDALPKAEVVKLCNHRVVWFRKYATTALGDEIGRAAHGPQGSAACYAVTRAGAEKLVHGLRRMEYPWDVALERGWASRTEIFTTLTNVARLERDTSTIAGRAAYRKTKFPWWRRLATYSHRIKETARRIHYALSG